jgi:uncharacterized phage protein gp47/JayE
MPGPYPLATLSVVFTPQGPVAPTFEDILASKQATYRGINGANCDLDPDTQDGQSIGIEAQAQYDTNQMAIAAYNSFSPATAQGQGLSSVVKINGLRKQIPTNSTAPLTIIGTAGLPIPSGIVSDQVGNYWDCPPNLTIPPSGQLDTTVTCEMPGAISAGPNTITRIVTIIPGWQTATNPEDATPGAPVEQDSALRQRQAVSTSMPAETPRMAIAAAVANVVGVQRSKVYQNDDDSFDANGIPGHSIAAVVAGGTAFDICAAIASKKSEGTGTFGSAFETVLDVQGVPNKIAYFPLALTQIYISLTIEPMDGYQATTAGLIAATLSSFIGALDIGGTVYISRLWGPANLTGDAAVNTSGLTQAELDQISATYVVRQILIAAMPNPNTAADIAISFNKAATSPTTNILIAAIA